jgi:hypothetical protein
VIQDCGCIAIPEGIARELGMAAGVRLGIAVDVPSRSIILTAPQDVKAGAIMVSGACPVKL